MCARATMPRTAPPAPSPRASGRSSRRFSPTPPRLLALVIFVKRRRCLIASHGRLQSLSRRELHQDRRSPAAAPMLVYGPDAGLVAERAAALAQIFAEARQRPDRDRPPRRSRSRRGPRTARGRAQDRADVRSQSVIRVTAGPRLDVPSLKALLADAVGQSADRRGRQSQTRLGLTQIIRDAQECRGAALLQRRERRLLGVIDAELAEAGLSIDRETRDYLMTRLGADQALSRSEVVKLALYAQGGERIEHDDIEAIVGDAAETALDNFAYAVERRRCEGGAVRTPAACGSRHRQVGGAVCARPALHAVASRRRGARRGRQPRAGREVAEAASAFQARAGVHRALQALGRDAACRKRCR